MKTYPTSIILISLMIFQLSARAQDAHESYKSKIEQLKSEKTAFLTRCIGLSPADAQKFWPVYNEFSQKMDSLWHLQKKESYELNEALERLTGSQKEAAIDQQMNHRWERARLEKEFHTRLKNILTIDQVIKFYDAEHEFKKRMLKLLRGSKTYYHPKKEDKDRTPEIPART